jgi:hypothetical protein
MKAINLKTIEPRAIDPIKYPASTPDDYSVFEDPDCGFFVWNRRYKVTVGGFPTEAAAWQHIEENCKREAAEDAAWMEQHSMEQTKENELKHD